MTAARNARPAAALLLSLLPIACSGGRWEHHLEDYSERLGRPLGVTIAAEPANPALPPRWTALQQPVEGGRLDGLDFLRLRGCALQQTVAQRNSSLGRLAPPSQRLLLELTFLRDVPACIELQRDKGNGELAALLEEARALKQKQLPVLILNATLANEEYRELWRARPLAADYPAQTSGEVVAALAAITAAAERWLAGDYRSDDIAFETSLGIIAGADGGELLTALGRQSTYLDAASEALRQRAAAGSLCPGGRQPRAATILRTVVTKFFIGDVQPRAAALSRRGHELLPPIRRLEALLEGVLPDAYRDWRDRREQQFTHADAAPKRHVRAVQSLLGDCFNEFARPDDAA